MRHCTGGTANSSGVFRRVNGRRSVSHTRPASTAPLHRATSSNPQRGRQPTSPCSRSVLASQCERLCRRRAPSLTRSGRPNRWASPSITSRTRCDSPDAMLTGPLTSALHQRDERIRGVLDMQKIPPLLAVRAERRCTREQRPWRLRDQPRWMFVAAELIEETSPGGALAEARWPTPTHRVQAPSFDCPYNVAGSGRRRALVAVAGGPVVFSAGACADESLPTCLEEGPGQCRRRRPPLRHSSGAVQ